MSEKMEPVPAMVSIKKVANMPNLVLEIPSSPSLKHLKKGMSASVNYRIEGKKTYITYTFEE